MKNSILQIIGQKKDILLSKAEALQVENIFSDNAISADFIIRLRNPPLSFRKGAIRTIEVHPDGSETEKNADYMKKFYEEERQNRIKYLSWTKEKLASYTDIFQGLFKISSGREATQEEIEKAKAIQLAFFKERPKRTLCDLYLFKPIIPMTVAYIDIWQSGFFRVVERAVYRDMQLAGEIPDIYAPKPYRKASPEDNPDEVKEKIKYNKDIDDEFDGIVQEALRKF